MFMIGGALGTLEAHVFPSVGPGFWALIGLAGVLGGVMRSPFTGVVFALELTHRFDAVLPLIIGATTAYAVSVLLLKRSVLTEKIARRGYHLSREYDVDPLEILFIGEVMERDITHLSRRPHRSRSPRRDLGSRPGHGGRAPTNALPDPRRRRPTRRRRDPHPTGIRRPPRPGSRHRSPTLGTARRS